MLEKKHLSQRLASSFLYSRVILRKQATLHYHHTQTDDFVNNMPAMYCHKECCALLSASSEEFISVAAAVSWLSLSLHAWGNALMVIKDALLDFEWIQVGRARKCVCTWIAALVLIIWRHASKLKQGSKRIQMENLSLFPPRLSSPLSLPCSQSSQRRPWRVEGRCSASAESSGCLWLSQLMCWCQRKNPSSPLKQPGVAGGSKGCFRQPEEKCSIEAFVTAPSICWDNLLLPFVLFPFLNLSHVLLCCPYLFPSHHSTPYSHPLDSFSLPLNLNLGRDSPC